MHAVGPPLRDPYGMALMHDDALVVERQPFRPQGLGILRKINLSSGRARWLLPSVASLRHGLTRISVSGLRRNLRFPSGEAKQFLRRLGFLDYPTAVKRVDYERVLVVESRRAFLLHVPTRTILMDTGDVCMNLADAAIHGEMALLLEGGTRAHGRILRWNLRNKDIRVVRENIIALAGIAVHFSGRYVLFTNGREAPDGAIIRCALDEHLQPGDDHTVQTGLHVPRYLCPTGTGGWYCSTGHGPVRIIIQEH